VAGKGEAYLAEIAFRKSGGKRVDVLVTGDKELDAKLKLLPKKLHDKLVKGALKSSGKILLAEYRGIVRTEAYDTGGMMRSASIKQAKLKRKDASSGKPVGVTLHIDRNKLLAKKLKSTGKTGLRKQRDIIDVHQADIDEMHYYPASIEFGYTRKNGTHVQGIRPQRRALYDNASKYKALFVADLKQLVAQQATVK
jgi:hypothetical protein